MRSSNFKAIGTIYIIAEDLKGNWRWRIPSSVGFDSLSLEAAKLKELLALYNRTRGLGSTQMESASNTVPSIVVNWCCSCWSVMDSQFIKLNQRLRLHEDNHPMRYLAEFMLLQRFTKDSNQR